MLDIYTGMLNFTADTSNRDREVEIEPGDGEVLTDVGWGLSYLLDDEELACAQ